MICRMLHIFGAFGNTMGSVAISIRRWVSSMSIHTQCIISIAELSWFFLLFLHCHLCPAAMMFWGLGPSNAVSCLLCVMIECFSSTKHASASNTAAFRCRLSLKICVSILAFYDRHQHCLVQPISQSAYSACTHLHLLRHFDIDIEELGYATVEADWFALVKIRLAIVGRNAFLRASFH